MKMRLMSLAVLAAAALAFAAMPAEAAKKKGSQVAAGQSARAQARVAVRRSPTRITVTRRSYLDAGTEVFPGSQNYTGYVFPPNYGSPAHFILGPGKPDGLTVPGTEPFWNPAYHVPNWGY